MDSNIVVIVQTTEAFFDDGAHQTQVYLLENLQAGHCINGPAIIVDQTRSVDFEAEDVQLQIVSLRRF